MDPFYLALLLYLFALALALVDLFVPSGGMLIVLATLAALAAVLFGFRSSHTVGMGMLTLVIATIPVFVFLAIKIWPHTPLGRRIILKLPEAKSAVSTSDTDSMQEMVGRVLIAETAFLPTGQVRWGHRRLNAVAESGYIEAGSHVRVLAVRERNLVVRPTHDPVSEQVPSAGTSSKSSSEIEPNGVGSADAGTSLLDRPADELGLESLDN